MPTFTCWPPDPEVLPSEKPFFAATTGRAVRLLPGRATLCCLASACILPKLWLAVCRCDKGAGSLHEKAHFTIRSKCRARERWVQGLQRRQTAG